MPKRQTPSPLPSLAKRPAKTLSKSFFDRSVLEVAPDLIGATLLVDGVGGRIVEVEAYHHTEPAAHSYRGPTPRNAVMFGPAGYLYVYRSYGIHWCMNFVCEPAGSASRSADPGHRADGRPAADAAAARCDDDPRLLCSGPGRLCEALRVTAAHNGLALDAPPFALLAEAEPVEIVVGVRIGLTKAVGQALALWREGLAVSQQAVSGRQSEP